MTLGSLVNWRQPVQLQLRDDVLEEGGLAWHSGRCVLVRMHNQLK